MSEQKRTSEASAIQQQVAQVVVHQWQPRELQEPGQGRVIQGNMPPAPPVKRG